MEEFGNAGNEGGPEGDNSQWKNHLGEDGAVHAHEEGPFRVLGHVARTSEVVLSVQ
jgi:hypothetical protein